MQCKFKIVDCKYSADLSKKYIFSLHDGEYIEAVYIKKSGENSNFCISSQVGCTNKCQYCKTGKLEYKRDLLSEEIVKQVRFIAKDNSLSDLGNVKVLYMGMGEPFFNYDNVVLSTRLINKEFGISQNNLIISTSGVIPCIAKYAKESFRSALAVSLNAPNSRLRSFLMPINKVYPYDELLDACYRYVEITNDKIIIEYILLDGVTDGLDQADELAVRIKDLCCDVHIIPFNSFSNSRFVAPTRENTNLFIEHLRAQGLSVLVKPSHAIDVYGGCGQLG